MEARPVKYINQSHKIFSTSLLKNIKKLVGIDWLSSPSYTYTHCFSNIGDNFVSNCSRYMAQPFVLKDTHLQKLSSRGSIWP